MIVLFRKDLDLASEASEAKAKTSKIQSSNKFVLVFIFRRQCLIMTKSMRMMILQKPHLLIFPDSMFWSEL